MKTATTSTTLTISNETRKNIETYLVYSEKFKNAYFWTPPQNASGRRSLENAYSLDFSFEYDGKKYRCSFSIDCSCKNIYVRKNIQVDGCVKDIRSLKKILKNA